MMLVDTNTLLKCNEYEQTASSHRLGVTESSVDSGHGKLKFPYHIKIMFAK
jgi:hypothetical protein